MAASEFQRTLMSNLSRQGMSVAGLARHTGYSPLLLDDLIAGRTRQIPVDFYAGWRYARSYDGRERRLGTVLGIWDREAQLALDECLTERSNITLPVGPGLCLGFREDLFSSGQPRSVGVYPLPPNLPVLTDNTLRPAIPPLPAYPVRTGAQRLFPLRGAGVVATIPTLRGRTLYPFYFGPLIKAGAFLPNQTPRPFPCSQRREDSPRRAAGGEMRKDPATRGNAK